MIQKQTKCPACHGLNGAVKRFLNVYRYECECGLPGPVSFSESDAVRAWNEYADRHIAPNVYTGAKTCGA